jgi:transcriptional regulator with XRE-family HTH domain
MPMRETNPLSGRVTRELIAANVRAELARASVSANSMAQRLGLPQSTFGRRMTGEVPFTAEEIAGIAGELGISPAVLLATPTAEAHAGHAA